MSRSVSTALSLALLFSLPAGLVHAGNIEVSSQVSGATIFTDRALVTRSAQIHLKAGENTVSITNLPAGLNEATLRVQGKANAAVKIGTVELKRIFLRDLANTAEREKQAQIDAKQTEQSLLQAEVKALEAKQGFINKLIEAGALKHDDNGNAKLDFTPEKWQQAWTLVQTGMGEVQKEITLKQVAIEKTMEDLAKLQLELNQIRSQQARERRDANVSIEASAETDMDLTLTYQTSGASWTPVYDARLDTNEGKLQLEQYGSVKQVTGEDWGNVALTLSTAQPASGSEMPPINEWWVHLFQPVEMMRKAKRDEERGYYSNVGVMSPQSLSRSADAVMTQEMAAPVPVEAEKVVATAATTEYSAEFKVPGRVNLKSTQDKTKLYLGEVKMKATLAAQTTPRLGTQAYLFAKATNPETYPLIPGEVAKYRDGAFIGNAALPLLRPNEEANFAFGVDDRIKVAYKQIKEKRDNPTLAVIGDMTIERQYETKVQNLHKDPIVITILDQYPVSSDADVKVTMVEDMTTAGWKETVEKRPGVIMWEPTLAPKEEKAFTLGFRVKYPKGRRVEGL